MFTFDQLQGVHLEITSRCQASCPMCFRNVHGGLPNSNLVLKDWSFDDFKNIINEEVLENLFQIYFCGQYGDPILNKDIIKMLQYVKERKPEIVVTINTNGSMHKEEWWKELASVLPEKHLVGFAIDGLEDTHHIYRIGTDWNKIINNAKAFISAGGSAVWEFIRFKHNEHQVDAVKKMSEELGFHHITVKDTSRFVNGEPFPIYDRDGNTIFYLEKSAYNESHFVTREMIENYKTIVKGVQLNCLAKKWKGIFIDSAKKVYPCSMTGMHTTKSAAYNDILDPIRIKADEELEVVFSKYPNDATTMSIKDILNSKEWQDTWNTVLSNESKLLTCAKNCGVIENVTKFYEENTNKTGDEYNENRI